MQKPAWMWAHPTGFLGENPGECQGMAVDEDWEAWKGDSLLLNSEQEPGPISPPSSGPSP